eukprot:1158556-Pelagomonas_calceolata.AAC.2
MMARIWTVTVGSGSQPCVCPNLVKAQQSGTLVQRSQQCEGASAGHCWTRQGELRANELAESVGRSVVGCMLGRARVNFARGSAHIQKVACCIGQACAWPAQQHS